MNFKPIIIVAGEPNSIFFEIFFKTINKNKFKSPIILIASKKIILKQSKILKKKINLNLINESSVIKNKLKKINLINVDYKQTQAFNKISSKSNKYISSCFDIAVNLIKKNVSDKLINGPISKKSFLNNKFNGITEYLANKTNTKKFAMIIYNKKLSVCPLTTHLPIKQVSNKINKHEIINNHCYIFRFGHFC